MEQTPTADLLQPCCTGHRAGSDPAEVRFERAVLGSDFGVRGWTTLAQADDLGRRLALGPGQRVLDLGSGQGWPGLYLAKSAGCDVVLVDQQVDGLRHGVERARREGINQRCAAVAATGRALPFLPGTFDAVVHSDVLCCLWPKGAVIRATRRALRPGGRTGFHVIHLAPGLSPEQRRRAVAAGPPAVATRSPSYPALLRAAGFIDIEQIDVTDTWSDVLGRWLRHARVMDAAPVSSCADRLEKLERYAARRSALDRPAAPFAVAGPTTRT